MTIHNDPTGGRRCLPDGRLDRSHPAWLLRCLMPRTEKGEREVRDLYSKCGANCGRCPAFRENIATDEDRQRCSDGWHRYLGARVRPDRINCDGCQTPDAENPALIVANCNIRKCATINGAQTCAHCSEYPCEDLGGVASTVGRDRAAARLGVPIPEEDYLAFIEPYELLKHLDEIRASLKLEDLVRPSPPKPFNPRIVDFPEVQTLSQEETAAYRALHRLLRALNTVDGDSYVMQRSLKKGREYFLKLLWTFGLYGELQEEGGWLIELGDDVYYEQKLAGHYDTVVNRYFRVLEECGLHCEHVPLGEGWLLPSGWMRRRCKAWDAGWLMKMAFGGEAGGVAALRALRTYTSGLSKEYGKRAFTRFSRADMRVLSEAQ